MKKILYVVHRYAPYPGGSENYVRDMAEETQKRGNHVAVFAGSHMGDLNGVYLSSDPNIIAHDWDLIVVHGGDVAVQDFAINNAANIRSPMLFMLIVPSESQTYVNGLQNCKYIGCSTEEDWDFVRSKGDIVLSKSVQIRHGIDIPNSLGTEGFKQKYGITTKYMFLSCGGYWPNKAMPDLVNVFNQTHRRDITLVLTGYEGGFGLPPSSDIVKPFVIEDRRDVMSAIKEADMYIMHSYKEGFGLVLLESMANRTPWMARELAGARLMKDYGFTYNTNNELLNNINNFQPVSDQLIENAYNHLIQEHSIQCTVDDILKIA